MTNYPERRRSRPAIQLTNAEMHQAYEVARGYASYGDNPNARELGKDPLEACRLGAMGELAACKFYGVKWEPVFRPDDGFDLKIGRFTANVKSTPFFKDPYLKVMDKLRRGCHAYVLVCVHLDTGYCEMAGWLRATEMHQMPLKSLKPGLPPCRLATEKDLRPCRPPKVA